MSIRITATLAALVCAMGMATDAPDRPPTGIPLNRMARTAMRATPPPSSRLPHRQLACLASAMWYEAGNEPRRGQVAVGEVVLERTRDPHFAPTPCGVLAQRNQFSFVHRGRIPTVPTETARDMESLARRVVDGMERSGLKHALFFHARYVHPGWSFVRLAAIGGHIFYSGERAG